MKRHCHVKVKEPALGVNFNKLLKIWIAIVEGYSKKYKNDAVYFYNERATLSTLAGAVWQQGNYALEEFYAAKDRKGKKFIGRSDIWFELGGKSYLAEAKQIWPSISKKANDLEEEFEKGFIAAEKDIKKLKPFRDESLYTFMEILFITPKLPPSDQDEKEIPLRIKKFIEVTEQMDSAFFAYLFSEPTHVVGDTGYLYPGVAILGRLVD